MLIVQNAITKKHISGLLRQEQEMKQKQNSSNAQSANILGENIDNFSYNIVNLPNIFIERGIKIEEAQNTIDMPDYTIRKDEKIESYKTINNKQLKIVYLQKGKFIKIITLIWK